MIYSTPFDPATRHCTGLSEATGFADFDDIVLLMGEPERRTAGMLIYPGLAYSRVILSLDGAVNSGISSALPDNETADHVSQ